MTKWKNQIFSRLQTLIFLHQCPQFFQQRIRWCHSLVPLQYVIRTHSINFTKHQQRINRHSLRSLLYPTNCPRLKSNCFRYLIHAKDAKESQLSTGYLSPASLVLPSSLMCPYQVDCSFNCYFVSMLQISDLPDAEHTFISTLPYHAFCIFLQHHYLFATITFDRNAS